MIYVSVTFIYLLSSPNTGDRGQSIDLIDVYFMCLSVHVCCMCVSPPIHLSVRTASHLSLVVKHCSLASLIRPPLNHLSVCVTVCSLFSSSSVLFSSVYISPVLHPALSLCTYSHIKQVPCFPQSLSLPSSLPALSPLILLCEEWVSTMELITAIQRLYLCLFTTQRRPGTQSPSSAYHHIANVHTRRCTAHRHSAPTATTHKISMSIDITTWQRNQ